MKKDPVKGIRFMLIILGFFVVAIPIISMFEKKKSPEWIFAVLFLFCSMIFIDAAFKHLKKRIEILEEKLNNQNLPKQ